MSTTVEHTSVEAGPFVGGRFVESSGQDRQDSVSPATGQVVGSFALGLPADVDRAVAAARDAFESWSSLTVFDRCRYLERLIEEIRNRREELARLLALEQGKPYRLEALPEIDETIANIRVAVELAKYLEGTVPQLADPRKRAFVYRVPRGVVAAIQPWNFPLGTASAQIAPALATGNTVVALPAPSTTLIEYEWARCFEAAGFPPGVFNLVTGSGAVVGDAMTAHPDVQVVAFTGSVATGRHIAARASGKAQLIELGGNGPVVVLDDADLDAVVPDALQSTYGAAGQSCTASGRFLVHDSVYDEFAHRLTEAVQREIKLGLPFDDATTMGPLNNAPLAEKLDRHLGTALDAGATLLTGGGRAKGFPTDLYWEPTVLTGVTESMAVAVEETFGPIAPLQRIASASEALELMHKSPYGLCAAVYTKDIARGLTFAEKAPSGLVNVNSRPGDTETHLPFGGRAGKLSGIGKILGRYPMEDVFTELKLISLKLG
ncbi:MULTISPECIES: aldehyde dehydrogenase family protein [unclassified Streptomyces]|uniref:aldehyde dehydrogenase family protein n=1 Tax=unclassified Streptomyces TaxID=2593676 RepID=UPI0036E680E8